ncbi:MDR family MFS transporter [Cellulomonas fimi]|uniref:Drug resistance transporter, EmrB/QacA subfamily n=1 Tax=Cellulomonas fimi (strain ATCC 484 / DSM 20113 / JCM 1341 / CCUG 24087 / LMG 16345 / NBRC 15513 / NCIMB 8980 / NCTC 7547 / NRS-133) TaxID=590998 RepID=F4H690_CELFA|nr:MDR family MFS transporter [Cellulomonas fimi]AEE44402.1 drug resistance transporter, EmrB/QacA subfamily [Cellulomonas fimi ATCC 484]NNH08294.1 MFS transporter [Cellulomonas fimi]VEH26290.1 Multidrug-efflux transporter 3 [Cellulomonas fimi]
MSSARTAPAPADATFQPPTHREIRTILGGLMLGMFLAALDQTIVATSIRTIGDDLHGLSLQAWVTTAYLLTATITTPLYGKLSDVYGRKPFYLLAIALFVVGSLLSGTADSMYQLALYRGVQGLGAGGLMALAITILGDLVAPRERARYQAYFLAVFGTSSVLGPVIGGFFAGADEILGVAGWRWVFLVNVPIGILAFVVIWRVLHLPPLRRVEHRIDWPGALALVVALVPLLVVAEQGRSWGWTSGQAVACYLTGLVGLVLFWLAERRAQGDAILPLHLFRNRTFSVGAAANTVIGLGMFGGLATLPLYLQIVRGQTPTEAGLTLIPFTVGIMTGSVVAGQTTSRTGRYKIFPVLGTILMVIGALLFSRFGVETPFAQIFTSSVVFGLGLGLTMQPLVLAVQNAVPVRDMGVATSSSLFFRQMGGTLGTAVFLSLLFSTVGGAIRDAFERLATSPDLRAALSDRALLADPANAAVVGALSGDGTLPSLDDSSFIGALDPRLARPFLEGFAESVDLVLLVAAGIMVLGVVLTVLLPELPLRDVSGIQGRLAEDADADAAGATAAAATRSGTDDAPPATPAGVTAVGGVTAVVADADAARRVDEPPR